MPRASPSGWWVGGPLMIYDLAQRIQTISQNFSDGHTTITRATAVLDRAHSHTRMLVSSGIYHSEPPAVVVRPIYGPQILYIIISTGPPPRAGQKIKGLRFPFVVGIYVYIYIYIIHLPRDKRIHTKIFGKVIS